MADQKIKNERFVWYFDLKWSIEELTQRTSDNLNSTPLQLKLSDGRKIEFAVKDLNQIRRMIETLEQAV